ncbi:MAG: terminase small subunit [Clostridia bacterium]|nr:terminase small subunit [Clostridia bacterium]
MALKEKEKLFCSYFSELRNARNAAAKAGYGILTHRNAVKLLAREDIRKEIERIDRTRLVSAEEVISGYRQLAFGSVADALKLVYADENPNAYELEGLELFNVSEIKRPKGGGIEIKFFDRLKALEHLEELCNGGKEDDSALPFYMALEKSAAALRSCDDE